MDRIGRKQQGLPYYYDDPAILGDQHQYQEKLAQYNRISPMEPERRAAMLPQLFAEIGPGCTVETPVHANWGCKHVSMGEGTYVSSNVTFVDGGWITIDSFCLIAPNVVFSTSGHPILPQLRKNHYVYNLPVCIGDNVWIGSGAQILPGVTIGENSVIGAGSVVTHDIPANVAAYGVPCKVIWEIGEQDRRYYDKDWKLDVWE